MHRKGQRVRFYDASGKQVGPEQTNVSPAVLYANVHGWHSPSVPRWIEEMGQREIRGKLQGTHLGSGTEVTVLYYTDEAQRGPAETFPTIARAVMNIRRYFDNRFYDTAHISQGDRAIALIHRFRKNESRWYTGRRPASLSPYFPPGR